MCFVILRLSQAILCSTFSFLRDFSFVRDGRNGLQKEGWSKWRWSLQREVSLVTSHRFSQTITAFRFENIMNSPREALMRMIIMSVGEFGAVYKNLNDCKSRVALQGKVQQVHWSRSTPLHPLASDFLHHLWAAGNADAAELADCDDDADVWEDRGDREGVETAVAFLISTSWSSTRLDAGRSSQKDRTESQKEHRWPAVHLRSFSNPDIILLILSIFA